MAVSFIQKNTSATFTSGCSGVTANSDTAARTADLSGSPGSTGVQLTITNNATRSVFGFKLQSPGVTTWASGTWSIPINFSSGDASVTCSSVYICRFNSSNTNLGTVASVTGLTNSTTAGTQTINVTQASDQTVNTTDYPYVVLSLYNSATMGTHRVTIVPDKTISSPIIIPVDITINSGVLITTASLQSPSIIAEQNINISLTTQILTANIISSSVQTSSNVNSLPSELIITSSLNDPSVSADRNININPEVLTASSNLITPSVLAEQNINLNLDVLLLNANLEAASVSTATDINISASVITTTININGIGVIAEENININSDLLSLSSNLISPSVDSEQNYNYNTTILNLSASLLDSQVLTATDYNFNSDPLSILSTLQSPSVLAIKNANIAAEFLSVISSATLPSILTGVELTAPLLSLNASLYSNLNLNDYHSVEFLAEFEDRGFEEYRKENDPEFIKKDEKLFFNAILDSKFKKSHDSKLKADLNNRSFKRHE